MIRDWIRRIVLQTLEDIHTPRSDRVGPQTSSIMGSPLVTVHRLSNGYLLASNNNTPYLSDGQTLVFCEDIGKIGDHIIAMETRVRMGISEHVRLDAAQRATLSNTTSTLSALAQQKYTP